MERLRVIILILVLLVLTVSLSSASTVMIVSSNARVNESFTVNITCYPSEPVKGYEMRLRFNQTILRCDGFIDSTFFHPYDSFISPHHGLIDDTNGTIRNIYEFVIGEGNVSGIGVLFQLRFTALHEGSSLIELYDVGLVNESKYLPVTVQNGTVTVSGFYTPPAGQQTDNNQFDQEQKDEPLTDWTSMLIIVLIIGFIIFAIFGKLLL